MDAAPFVGRALSGRPVRFQTYAWLVVTEVVAGGALLVGVYGAWLSTRTYLWQRRRDDQRRHSDVMVEVGERYGLGGQAPVIGATLAVEHILVIRVVNGGEAPEYIHEIHLENQQVSPITVSVRKPEGTVEVRPRDQHECIFALDGSQAFDWDAPFRAVVRLANKAIFHSEYGRLSRPPEHGEQVVIPDPDQVPDAQVIRVSVIPGSPTAVVHEARSNRLDLRLD